jgi:acetyl-CoA acetyltransferase
MSTTWLRDKTAIVGVGATEFSKRSGRSEMQLAAEAVTAALADAGIDPAEVDGISTYSMDKNPELEVLRLIGGRELKFFSRVEYGGGGACAPILHAALAIAGGVCDVAVVYRAMNERSNYRFGDGQLGAMDDFSSFIAVNFSNWYLPYGLMSPAAFIAISVRRYMQAYGVTSADFGRVAVAAREFAATNPAAYFYQRPITLEEHQQSRWVAEPIRLLDCCQESDGAVALVLTSAARAKDLRRRPVYVKAAAQGATDRTRIMTSYDQPDITELPEKALVARSLYAMAGLAPADIQAAVLYDHFSPYVLRQLEVFGFCAPGEAKDFVRDGHIGRGGSLPVNPHGGQLGEAYIHGMNGVAEAVRQLRGTAVNQVAGVEHMLVTGGDGLPTSGLILGAG